MKRVPNTNHVTEIICKFFSGYLQVDAKYVSVRPHERKMAFIWAIDYYTHDIVWWTLAREENWESYYFLFKGLKGAGYQLRTLTCDDHKAIRQACYSVYGGGSNIQLCLTHYKRNIQKKLDIRHDQRDRLFMDSIKNLFTSPNGRIFHGRGKSMLRSYSDEKRYVSILSEIDLNLELLTTYQRYAKCPGTNNLIEGFNKHLAIRVRGLDGFKSYTSASLWLNSYVSWRRSTPFQNCRGRFKRLNGVTSLSQTAGWDVPEIYMFR